MYPSAIYDLRQVKLFRVLKAFANFNRKKGVTYCQGMNFIAGVLVIVMEEEVIVSEFQIIDPSSKHFGRLFSS
jgi:hypothetical protein